jgi:hypothetical protein
MQIHSLAGRCTSKQVDIQADRETDRQAGRHTGKPFRIIFFKTAACVRATSRHTAVR